MWKYIDFDGQECVARDTVLRVHTKTRQRQVHEMKHIYLPWFTVRKDVPEAPELIWSGCVTICTITLYWKRISIGRRWTNWGK